MSFFGNTLEGAKKICSSLENKTVTTVEVQKLKIKAIKIDNELSKVYEKLGALYCKELRKRDDLPENLELLLNSVDTKRAEIAEIKEQISAFKSAACGEYSNSGSEGESCCFEFTDEF